MGHSQTIRGWLIDGKPGGIVGRYAGSAWESGFIQVGVTSADNQIQLLGGQYMMRLEVNALGLFCFDSRLNLLNYFKQSESTCNG